MDRQTQTDRQTDRQRKQTLRTPFFEFIFLIFDFIFKERSDYIVQDGGTKSKEVIQSYYINTISQKLNAQKLLDAA